MPKSNLRPRHSGDPYTARELADALRVSYPTICGLCASGVIRAMRIGGKGTAGVWRISDEAAREFMAQAERAATEGETGEYEFKYLKVD